MSIDIHHRAGTASYEGQPGPREAADERSAQSHADGPPEAPAASEAVIVGAYEHRLARAWFEVELAHAHVDRLRAERAALAVEPDRLLRDGRADRALIVQVAAEFIATLPPEPAPRHLYWASRPQQTGW